MGIYRVGIVASFGLLGVASVPCDVPDTTPIPQLVVHAIFAMITFTCLLYYVYLDTFSLDDTCSRKKRIYKQICAYMSFFGLTVLIVGIIYIVVSMKRAAGMTIISIGEIWMVLSTISWLSSFIGEMNDLEMRIVKKSNLEIPL